MVFTCTKHLEEGLELGTIGLLEEGLEGYRHELCHKLTVWHVPLNLSKLLLKSPQLPNSILTCKVTGRRVNRSPGYDLEIPVTYICTETRERSAWIQRKISVEMKTTEKIKINA